MTYQKPMLRQIERRVQNRPITNNGVLSETTLFFKNFVSVQEPLIKSWFDVPTTQIPILALFVSTAVLLDGVFSLRVSLKYKNCVIKSTLPERFAQIKKNFIQFNLELSQN